jgi:hypothetical protein
MVKKQPRNRKNKNKEQQESNWGSFVATLITIPIVMILTAYVTINSFTNTTQFPTTFTQYPFDKRAKLLPSFDPLKQAMELFTSASKMVSEVLAGKMPSMPENGNAVMPDKNTPKPFQLSTKSPAEYGYGDHVKDFAALVINQSTMNKYKIQNEINSTFKDVIPNVETNSIGTAFLFLFAFIPLSASLLFQSILSVGNTSIVALMKYFQGLTKGYFILDWLFGFIYFAITMIYLIPYTFLRNMYELFYKPLNFSIVKSKVFITMSILSFCLAGVSASNSALIGTEKTIATIVSVLMFPILYYIIDFPSPKTN